MEVYIHRIEVTESGVFGVMQTRKNRNCLGVKYSLVVDTIDDISAHVYGWGTGKGKPVLDTRNELKPVGIIYAPRGFVPGGTVFAELYQDPAVLASKLFAGVEMERFLDNFATLLSTNSIKDFSLAGEIEKVAKA